MSINSSVDGSSALRWRVLRPRFRNRPASDSLTDLTRLSPKPSTAASRPSWAAASSSSNGIFEYLEIFHNRQRRHSSLEMLTPRLGEDAAAIDVEAGCLVVAADPITLTAEGIGWSAVAVNANDLAVMGVRPRWFLATVLLPVPCETRSPGFPNVELRFRPRRSCRSDLDTAPRSAHDRSRERKQPRCAEEVW